MNKKTEPAKIDFRKYYSWPWNLSTTAGIDVENECGKLMHSVECLKMALACESDPKGRDYLHREIENVKSKHAELLRLARADDLPDAETRRKQLAGRVKAVADGKHKPRRPNAAGLTVDAPEVKAAYILQRNAKSRNTHNAAADVVAKRFKFTKGQVMRAAERGNWFPR